jgi:hypothetical protein
MLDREEYVEQAYLFRAMNERIQQNLSTQELLVALKQEVLSTTKLPMALDFMASELRLTGGFATAMARMDHYFTPFQTYVVSEAERDDGRLDFRVALEILRREAEYRAQGATPQAVFVYQFETLCRNRLGYDRGLSAIADDPIFDADWRAWILTVRRQVGIVDFADLLYVRSEHYKESRGEPERPILFGRKEGQIALAHRQKDPLFLFSALQRHLGYPAVPRAHAEETQRYTIPMLQRRVERLETRIKLLEEELRGGINLGRFYVAQAENKPPPQ